MGNRDREGVGKRGREGVGKGCREEELSQKKGPYKVVQCPAKTPYTRTIALWSLEYNYIHMYINYFENDFEEDKSGL